MNKCRSLPSGFPRAHMKSGINRVLCQLKRVTIKFCKSSGSSRGVRSFIEQDIIDFTRNNPEVVVYLKPRRHHGPVLVSEYLNGERHYHSINNFTRDEVCKWILYLRNRMGIPNTRFRLLNYTTIPSIQGVWNPFTFKDPTLNITSFPSEAFTVPAYMPPTATERLREMFEKQKLTEAEDRKLGEHVKIVVQR